MSRVIAACVWPGVAAVALTAEMQGILDQHNIYRCMHDIPTMTWDADLAASAQSWADGGEWKHSASSDRVINGVQAGENLAWGSPSQSGEQATRNWYSEIQFTEPYGTADNMQDTTVQGEAIGHYTQVVWTTSTKLGCGKGAITGRGGDYWVCQYSPAGNYIGQFTSRVTAPKKMPSECGGTMADVPNGFSVGGPSSPTPPTPPSPPATPVPTPAPAALPSSCVPEPLLSRGGLCSYGFQCASKFCCPRLRVCLDCPSCSLSSADINVLADVRDTVIQTVFGGTCSDPYSHSSKCMQTSQGQPLQGWDQSVCGCADFYMDRYYAGTWITLNEGVTCPTPTPTLAPRAPTPAPSASTLAPSAPTPAPSVPTPAPSAPTPAPSAPTPAPSVPTPPTPAASAPTPAASAPTPSASAPTPAPVAPTPAPSAPTPAREVLQVVMTAFANSVHTAGFALIAVLLGLASNLD